VETALVYNRQTHPKTIPVLVRNLKRRLALPPGEGRSPAGIAALNEQNGNAKRPPRSEVAERRIFPVVRHG